jgi:four helix bundle protein
MPNGANFRTAQNDGRREIPHCGTTKGENRGAMEACFTRWEGYASSHRRCQRGAMPVRNLNVLDAAEQAARQINVLIDAPRRPRLLHVRQLRKSAQSVVANIAEGFGRGTGRDRNRPLEIARGESEETIRHLNANFQASRIPAADYRPLHNRYVVIVKMLNALING